MNWQVTIDDAVPVQGNDAEALISAVEKSILSTSDAVTVDVQHVKSSPQNPNPKTPTPQ